MLPKVSSRASVDAVDQLVSAIEGKIMCNLAQFLMLIGTELPEAVFCLADMAGNGRVDGLTWEPRILPVSWALAPSETLKESILMCSALFVHPACWRLSRIRCTPLIQFLSKLQSRPRWLKNVLRRLQWDLWVN